MFAQKEYDDYVRAQERADELYSLECMDESFAEAASKAQDEADLLYEIYDHAAGLKALEECTNGKHGRASPSLRLLR